MNIEALNELNRDEKILHIQDAQWCLWRLKGQQEAFRMIDSEVLNAMSDIEINELYTCLFQEISTFYAPFTQNTSPADDAKQKPVTQLKPLRIAGISTHQKTMSEDEWKHWWKELAPKIIVNVAYELLHDRPIYSDSPREIRFGNKGSWVINKEAGTFFDYETGIGGGLKAMIAHLLGIDDSGVKAWLKNQGFLDNTFTPTDYQRPKAKSAPKTQSDVDMYDKGLAIWNEAESIPFDTNHPARRWAAHRNLLPLLLPFPSSIRFHPKQNFIIVAMAPIRAFVDAFPNPPHPKQFHLIAINTDGTKRYPFGKGTEDKRTWGRSQDCCVICIGNPNTHKINICEGVADALAIYSREPGAVIATLTTPNKLDSPQPLAYLTEKKRVTYIYGDHDKAGRKAADNLQLRIAENGGDPFVIVPETNQKTDPADTASTLPFPAVPRQAYNDLVKAFHNTMNIEPERTAWLSLNIDEKDA